MFWCYRCSDKRLNTNRNRETDGQTNDARRPHVKVVVLCYIALSRRRSARLTAAIRYVIEHNATIRPTWRFHARWTTRCVCLKKRGSRWRVRGTRDDLRPWRRANAVTVYGQFTNVHSAENVNRLPRKRRILFCEFLFIVDHFMVCKQDVNKIYFESYHVARSRNRVYPGRRSQGMKRYRKKRRVAVASRAWRNEGHGNNLYGAKSLVGHRAQRPLSTLR